MDEENGGAKREERGNPKEGTKRAAVFKLLWESFDGWQNDNASQLAAALAFYTIFSIAPLLIIAIAVAGAVFGTEAARGEMVAHIQRWVGPSAAKLIGFAISNARNPTSISIASLVGVILLLFGASRVFVQLQQAMNTVWNVQLKPGHVVKEFVVKRIVSFLMVLGTGVLILAALILGTALTALSHYVGEVIPMFWRLLDLGLSFGLVTAVFAMIYKFFPDVEIGWRDVWIGATITALLFGLGKFALGFYLGREAFRSTYGAAGSLAGILAWVYYSAQIFFFGAEFTQAYSQRFGSRIVPRAKAESGPKKKDE
jgi:membrane protein